MGYRGTESSWWNLFGVIGLTASLLAQAGRSSAEPPRVYHPLNQLHPPGMSAAWASRIASTRTVYFQPIRFSFPTHGRLTLYDGSPQRPVTLNSSPDALAQAGLAVGQTYRVKISHLPEYPGIELFPSIEVLDRLHAPPGAEHEFPVPLEFSAEEIELALEGRMVSRVVFLEQPQLAIPQAFERRLPVTTVPAHFNLLAEADRRGRPMLIVRLGGRLPDSHGSDPAFFGTGAPVSVSDPFDTSGGAGGAGGTAGLRALPAARRLGTLPERNGT